VNVTASSTMQAATVAGTVDVTASKLSLTGNSSSIGGNFSVSSGATLGFDGNSSISGNGTAEFGSGTVNCPTDGTPYDVTGGLTVGSGLV
jgi:hypothetical protein